MRTVIRIREPYCAAMSLRDAHADEAENQRRFGRWTIPHGHDFMLEVAVGGPVDERQALVMDFARLRRLVQRVIIRHVDHRCLNDIEWMRGLPPTYENQAAIYWERLARALPRGVQLVSLSVEDSQGNRATREDDGRE